MHKAHAEFYLFLTLGTIISTQLTKLIFYTALSSFKKVAVLHKFNTAARGQSLSPLPKAVKKNK